MRLKNSIGHNKLFKRQRTNKIFEIIMNAHAMKAKIVNIPGPKFLKRLYLLCHQIPRSHQIIIDQNIFALNIRPNIILLVEKA
jgi:hypothetical protein